jgi:hypothetical protein
MRVGLKLLVLGLGALVGMGALTVSAAWGSTPEDPFWTVAGKRLESGSKKALLKDRTGVETVLHGKIASTEVQIRCKGGALGEGAIEGSASKHDGKASGVLELSECKLWAKEGEAFKERPECEIPSIKSGKLSGFLWLEGAKAAEGTTTVVVFEPKELTEGKQLIAKVAINKEGCSYKGAYALEGSFAARLLPQNEEFTYSVWVQPETAITAAWRPESEAGETGIGLKLEGNTATLQGELEIKLESEEGFGGGTAPVAGIEAPFWKVNNKRLEAGEEKEVEAGAIAEPAKLTSKIKGKEVETRCKSVFFKEGKLEGSQGQSDGKFVTRTIELTECKIFVREGEAFKEQPACEVAPLATNRLSGRLWLEGTKEERGERPLLVLEPETMTEGKPVIANEKIKSKAGETCAVAEEKYAIEGAIPLRLTPENEEAAEVHLSVVGESSTSVWQPAEQEGKKKVKLMHEEEPITLKLPEVPIKTKGGEKFGGGFGGGVGRLWFECAEKAGGKYTNNKCTAEGSGGKFEWVEITKATEVVMEGELELEDSESSIGAVRVKCKIMGEGTVLGSTGSIAVVKLEKCAVVKGTCGSPTAEAIHLPWSTELKEEASDEIRDEIKNSGSGLPGYTVTCTVIIKIKDTCEGETTAGIVDSLKEGLVEATFEAKSSKLTCSLSKKVSGSVGGTLKIMAKSGAAISAK